jgi:ABC-type antimicrobial peptide transport system permease subunit
MFRHNLKISFRNFKRYKTSFFINLTGLSTGLACALLIYLWINDELRYDKFHENDDRLYAVMSNFPAGSGVIFTYEAVPGLLAQALEDEFPEIEDAVVAAPPKDGRETLGIISDADTQIKASELYVSNNFFKVFSFQLIEGNRDMVLDEKYSVLLSDELAMKMFQTTEHIIGKTVEWDRTNLSGSYIVSGIFKKPPRHSTFQFDLLFTYDIFFEKYSASMENWQNNHPGTYILVRESTDIENLNAKIRYFKNRKILAINEKANLDKAGSLFLQKFSDRYLYNRYENGVPNGGRMSYVKLFGIIAIFLLFIACINFMNLSTARASCRMKEIGIKKVIGVDRRLLISQFLTESFLITFISMAVAMLITGLSIPVFNQITGKHIGLNFNFNLILSIFCISLITSLLAGSYPAIYLSGGKPAFLLKSKFNSSVGEFWARKGLVVFQFAISVILISSVMVIYEQINFIQTKNLGYNRYNIITFKKEGKLNEDTETFLTEIKNIPGVVNASYFSHDMTGNYGSTSAMVWEGKNPDDNILFGNLEIGYDLIEMMEFEMVEGRSFSEMYGSENSKIIFNESAIAAMGLKDPVGKTVKLWGADERQIIGVVRDFHFESLYEKVKPCFLQWYPPRRNILVKIKPGMEKETIERIGKFYQSYNNSLPFEYKFIDDDYQALYASEQRAAVLSKFFAGIAILVSCLGLSGLAVFTAQKHIKEIGIRKILGSSVFAIVRLLSGEFTIMVLIAIIIALPLSYLIAINWLEGFAYHINLKWWFFTGAGALALITAWLTVGMQTYTAARINPADCLKEE